MASDMRVSIFMKLSSSLFLATVKRGELFIGREWALTPHPENALTAVEVFEKAAAFLQQNKLKVGKDLTQAQAATFWGNLQEFSHHCAEVGSMEKVMVIRKLLYGPSWQERIQKILAHKRMSPQDSSELGNYLCHLDLERKVLSQLVELFFFEEQYYRQFLNAFSWGIRFYPQFEEGALNWNFEIDLSGFQEKLGMPPEALNDMSKRQHNIGFLKALRGQSETLDASIEAALAWIELHHMRTRRQEVYMKISAFNRHLNSARSQKAVSGGDWEFFPEQRRAAWCYKNFIDAGHKLRNEMAAHPPELYQSPLIAESFIDLFLQKAIDARAALDLIVQDYEKSLAENNRLYRQIYNKLAPRGKNLIVPQTMQALPMPKLFESSSIYKPVRVPPRALQKPAPVEAQMASSSLDCDPEEKALVPQARWDDDTEECDAEEPKGSSLKAPYPVITSWADHVEEWEAHEAAKEPKGSSLKAPYPVITSWADHVEEWEAQEAAKEAAKILSRQSAVFPLPFDVAPNAPVVASRTWASVAKQGLKQ